MQYFEDGRDKGMARTVFGGGQRQRYGLNSIWRRAETKVWLEQYFEDGRD